MGGVKYVHVLGRVVKGDEGEARGFIGTMQDVTHIKEAELEKEKTEMQLLRAQKTGGAWHVGRWYST